MKNSLLALFIALAGCSSHNPGAVAFDIPLRAPLSSVQVKTVAPDGICPGGAFIYMDRRNFQNLQSNVINSETYIQQLENLLRSMQGEKEEQN